MTSPLFVPLSPASGGIFDIKWRGEVENPSGIGGEVIE
jgi:hypothetical protein